MRVPDGPSGLKQVLASHVAHSKVYTKSESMGQQHSSVVPVHVVSKLLKSLQLAVVFASMASTFVLLTESCTIDDVVANAVGLAFLSQIDKIGYTFLKQALSTKKLKKPRVYIHVKDVAVLNAGLMVAFVVSVLFSVGLAIAVAFKLKVVLI